MFTFFGHICILQASASTDSDLYDILGYTTVAGVVVCFSFSLLHNMFCDCILLNSKRELNSFAVNVDCILSGNGTYPLGYNV